MSQWTGDMGKDQYDKVTWHITIDICRGGYIAEDFLLLKDMIVSFVNRFKSKNLQEYYKKVPLMFTEISTHLFWGNGIQNKQITPWFNFSIFRTILKISVEEVNIFWN